MMASENIDTEAMRKHTFLKEKYGCADIPLEYRMNQTSKLELFNDNVEKRMQERLTET